MSPWLESQDMSTLLQPHFPLSGPRPLAASLLPLFLSSSFAAVHLLKHSCSSLQISKEMATVLANLPLSVIIHGTKTLPRSIYKPAFRPIPGHATILVKAVGENSETSTSLSIIKSVQNVWDKSEDRVGLIGIGFSGIILLCASINLISAIDKLPVIPSLLEFIGILYSAWFAYRYVLFKPDRAELVQNLNKSISDILGQ